MNIIAKEKAETSDSLEQINYKASFVTADGIIHRVDFSDKGRVKNLCVYTGFEPDILIDDLQILIDKIRQAINK